MTPFDTVGIPFTFVLHVALVTVCMMRRRADFFPLPGVIGPWMMASVSTLSLAQLAIGDSRFQQILQRISEWCGFDDSSDPLSGPIYISFQNVISLISAAGYCLFAIGIYRLARRRIREATELAQSLPHSP